MIGKDLKLGMPVKLIWHDALGVDDQLTVREVAEMRPVACESYGLLLALAADHITIASTKGETKDEANYSDALCIPQKWIVSVVPLVEVKDHATAAIGRSMTRRVGKPDTRKSSRLLKSAIGVTK